MPQSKAVRTSVSANCCRSRSIDCQLPKPTVLTTRSLAPTFRYHMIGSPGRLPRAVRAQRAAHGIADQLQHLLLLVLDEQVTAGQLDMPVRDRLATPTAYRLRGDLGIELAGDGQD